MRYIPSRKAAQELGLHPNTLRKYADDGRIQTIRTASGQRRYDVDSFVRESADAHLVCYCRVSSSKQRDDLQRQVAHMRELYPQAEIIQDVGGGLNWKRKGLLSLLERLHSGDKLQVVVAHRDRLARFGFELLVWLVERNGGQVVVLGGTDHSPEQELIEDILAILHTFSCRLHGLRRYKDAIKADSGLSESGTGSDDPVVAGSEPVVL